MLEIKHVLGHFCTPFLAILQACEQAIDASPPLPFLKVLFEDLLLLHQIFYDLNSQDIPEFFEDNMAEFMRIMRKFLLYKNPALEGPPPDEDEEDEEEEDPVTKVKTAICENIDLYAKRYEDVFQQLQEFVESVWGLLTAIGRSTRYDLLVSKAIAFLTSVARPARHASLFSGPGVLDQIVEKIVLPNIVLRPMDVNEFEDEPMAYLRREIEGSDIESRRRAATELVRGLMEHFEAQVTGACGRYIEGSLASYEQNRKANWKEKDTALYLIMALGAKSVSERAGATKVNPNLPFLQVLTSTVLPDLRSAADDASTHPMIKVDALKYVSLFRSQLDKSQLLGLLSDVIKHLESSNVVVYSYAAYVIEKILGMKDRDGMGKLMCV